jgi:hypothetical protein
MASGPWFYEVPVTINAGGVVSTDLQLFPGRAFVLDTPITSRSWAWASITEVDEEGRPKLGDAILEVASITPQDDGSIWVRIVTNWDGNNLPGLVRLLFWASL